MRWRDRKCKHRDNETLVHNERKTTGRDRKALPQYIKYRIIPKSLGQYFDYLFSIPMAKF